MLPRSLLLKLFDFAFYVADSLLNDLNVLIRILPQPCIGSAAMRGVTTTEIHFIELQYHKLDSCNEQKTFLQVSRL